MEHIPHDHVELLVVQTLQRAARVRVNDARIAGFEIQLALCHCSDLRVELGHHDSGAWIARLDGARLGIRAAAGKKKRGRQLPVTQMRGEQFIHQVRVGRNQNVRPGRVTDAMQQVIQHQAARAPERRLARHVDDTNAEIAGLPITGLQKPAARLGPDGERNTEDRQAQHRAAGRQQECQCEQTQHRAPDARGRGGFGSDLAAAIDQAVADGQLPDPKLAVGAYNLPVDDFSYDREPTTQFRTRIQQAFPRGATLRYQRQHTEWLGKAELARAALARREIERDLRTTFLELYYQQRAAGVVEQSRVLFQQLVTITRSHFATARASQQDVLQAQLELSRLEDRAATIEGDIEEQRARLARWLGDYAWQSVGAGFPVLPALPALTELEAGLPQHPAVQAASAQLQANQEMVKAAREQYKPGWDVGLEYRKRFAEEARGDDLPDMMAAMVTMDLPLFTGKRQDKRLAASRQNAEAARQMREQRLRELRAVAAEMSIRPDNTYSGEMVTVPPTGEARAQILSDYCDAEGFHLDECVAYADSSSDLPLFEAVGFPVAVNPETRLATIARKRGWLVEQWSKAPGAEPA